MAKAQGLFMTTRWSRIVAAGQEDGDRSRQALGELCRDYWKPLYFFARRKGKSPEDAQDLTQGFIASLLESQTLSRADKSLGRFRSFLLSSFTNYIINEHRQGTALKRGGGRPTLPLDDPGVEESYAAQETTTPELLYDRSWALALLNRGMQRLREEYAKAGRLPLYERIQPIVSGSGGGLGHAQIAAELGMTEGAVTVSVHRMRKRYGQLLREEIAETVESEAEIESELRHLISVVS
jgi:RNA polymerase sigma-70 factor (ECF subfamily)